MTKINLLDKGYIALHDDDGSGVTANNPLQHCEYRVLEPVKTSPQNTDDIIANLVARVAELERQVKEHIDVLTERIELARDETAGVKNDIETWSREIETLKHASKETDDKIEMVIDDIVTLDERTADVKPRRCCGC